jgi:hypothetical protein
MRAGRRCKKGVRERNGRVQRPPRAYHDPAATALNQPHRRNARDPKDPYNESPLGRLILRQELPRVCFDHALNYAQLVRRLFAAKGVPQPVRTGIHKTAEGK